jgi:hypothetical protein
MLLLVLIVLTLSPGITTAVQVIPKDISYLKRKRMQTGEQQVYLLKAWVKDIEPPINSKYFLLNKYIM